MITLFAIVFLFGVLLLTDRSPKKCFQPVPTIPSWALARLDNQPKLMKVKVLPSLERRGSEFGLFWEYLCGLIRTPSRRMVFA